MSPSQEEITIHYSFGWGSSYEKKKVGNIFFPLTSLAVIKLD